jgi:hypothetical protein
MATIRISLNEDIERILESLKSDYPALDYPELFKLGLSELYRKRELESRKAWAESMPELVLTDAERDELSEALDEADEASERGKKAMSVDELMTHLKSSSARLHVRPPPAGSLRAQV